MMMLSDNFLGTDTMKRYVSKTNDKIICVLTVITVYFLYFLKLDLYTEQK